MHMILILMATASQAAEAPPQSPPPMPIRPSSAWSEPLASPPAAEQPVELPEVKVTCRTQRVTGTRVIRKICRTADQQRQADLEARNKIRMGTQVQTTEVFKRPSGE